MVGGGGELLGDVLVEFERDGTDDADEARRRKRSGRLRLGSR